VLEYDHRAVEAVADQAAMEILPGDAYRPEAPAAITYR
jgi:hypothetical protein